MSNVWSFDDTVGAILPDVKVVPTFGYEIDASTAVACPSRTGSDTGKRRPVPYRWVVSMELMLSETNSISTVSIGRLG